MNMVYIVVIYMPRWDDVHTVYGPFQTNAQAMDFARGKDHARVLPLAPPYRYRKQST